MREQIRDKERLNHMLESITEIQKLTDKEWVEEINNNHLLFYSLVKLLEIIGEAAYKLTKEFKQEHPQLEWQPIENLRHVLVHGYYKIRLGLLIGTVHDDIPHIKEQIEKFLLEN